MLSLPALIYLKQKWKIPEVYPFYVWLFLGDLLTTNVKGNCAVSSVSISLPTYRATNGLGFSKSGRSSIRATRKNGSDTRPQTPGPYNLLIISWDCPFIAAKNEAETPEGTARSLCRRLLALSQKADWDAASETLKVQYKRSTLRHVC